MAKNNNLKDFLTDLADTIRKKKGTNESINPQNFADEIASIGKWTGHADVEGLKAIGWTDEDIAYYQENGVNWNAEDDHLHLVSDDNKALYGVLTVNNISTYKDRIVYLPKIDTSAKTTMSRSFFNAMSLVAIPQLDMHNVTDMSYMFENCYSLVSIPLFDTSNVTTMYHMFNNCYSLISIPQLDTSNVTSMSAMFRNCCSLVSIPQLNVSKVRGIDEMFYNCCSLVSIPQMDTANVTSFDQCLSHTITTVNGIDLSGLISECDMNHATSLTNIKIKNLKSNILIQHSCFLSKESLLYLINNEAAESAITIKLASYAYMMLSSDPDIVAALKAHPRVSISQ